MAQRKWVVDREFEVEGIVFPVGTEFPTGRLKKEIRDILESKKCIHVEGDEEESEQAPAPFSAASFIQRFNQEANDGEDQ